MTEKAMRILDEMIKDNELLAKYGYEKYQTLCDICKELKEKGTTNDKE